MPVEIAHSTAYSSPIRSVLQDQCDARSTILGHRAPLIHTWAPCPRFLLFPKFCSAVSLSLSLSSVLITILALCPLVFPPLCILNNYSSPWFCQVSDVYPEPFEYSITFGVRSGIDRLPSIEGHIKKKKNRLPSIRNSSPFCQVSDVYLEPFEYSITIFSNMYHYYWQGSSS